MLEPADFTFFLTLAGAGSLSAAARELGVTTSAVSKHLTLMESRLGLRLVQRTTRRMALTPEGELVLAHARRIRDEIDGLRQALVDAKATPSGLLRVNATLGFGRRHVAPVVSRFVKRFPRVDVRLQLSVDPPPLDDDAFDVGIRFGAPPDARVVARRLAANRRLLCASPAYLARHGTPQRPRDLAHHACIGIRQGDEAYGVCKLSRGPLTEAVKTREPLATNDGAVAVQWALDGHGIVLRAEWDLHPHLRAGRLVEVLPQYRTPDADIHAIVPQRLQSTARVRAFVDFLAESLQAQRTGGPRIAGGASAAGDSAGPNAPAAPRRNAPRPRG